MGVCSPFFGIFGTKSSFLAWNRILFSNTKFNDAKKRSRKDDKVGKITILVIKMKNFQKITDYSLT